LLPRIFDLENDSQSKLDHATIQLDIAILSKTKTCDARKANVVEREISTGIPNGNAIAGTGVIERIEHFQTDLIIYSLIYPCVLEQAKVQLIQSWTA
jgi:hypothetical protein